MPLDRSPETSTALAAVTDEALAAYERDGAVILRGVLQGRWIDRMRVAVDEILANPTPSGSELGADGPGRFYGDFFLWRRHPEFRAFVFDSPLAEVAARMMRARTVNFFYEQLLVKEPGTEARTPWHQDLPYWPLAGWQIVSLWVPFDRTTPETGVVTYVRGSHLWGKLYRPRPFGPQSRSSYSAGASELEDAPDVDAQPWSFDYVTGVLEPGDVFVHHARTLHGAPGNGSSTDRRRALATRWTGEDVRYHPRSGDFLNQDRFADLRPLAPLAPGDRLDCELFPRVLPRGA